MGYILSGGANVRQSDKHNSQVGTKRFDKSKERLAVIYLIPFSHGCPLIASSSPEFAGKNLSIISKNTKDSSMWPQSDSCMGLCSGANADRALL